MPERRKLTRKLSCMANAFRQQTLIALHKAGTGHPGGSLSAMDVLTALYYSEMRIKPQEPDWPDRDRFILSKGHACPALYVVLANKGFFDKDELNHLRKTGALLQGSTDRKVPGLEMSTGSLGQGLSVGVGMALGTRYHKRDSRVYVMLGDGESAEGQVWEAAMSGAHYELGNLTAILDYNKLQAEASNAETMNLEPIVHKWNAFGWDVVEIDGHDFDQILDAFEHAEQVKDRPTKIIAHTTKGKGVSFMENVVAWHGSNVPNAEELEIALAGLRETCVLFKQW